MSGITFDTHLLKNGYKSAIPQMQATDIKKPMSNAESGLTMQIMNPARPKLFKKSYLLLKILDKSRIIPIIPALTTDGEKPHRKA